MLNSPRYGPPHQPPWGSGVLRTAREFTEFQIMRSILETTACETKGVQRYNSTGSQRNAISIRTVGQYWNYTAIQTSLFFFSASFLCWRYSLTLTHRHVACINPIFSSWRTIGASIPAVYSPTCIFTSDLFSEVVLGSRGIRSSSESNLYLPTDLRPSRTQTKLFTPSRTQLCIKAVSLCTERGG